MALLYIETFKKSTASVTMQYNLVLVKAVGKHADWACVQDETQAEPLGRWIERHTSADARNRTTNIKANMLHRIHSNEKK